MLTLPTPGKADVQVNFHFSFIFIIKICSFQVVILADPDGYEICFVGEEGFSELSQVDPQAGQLIEDAIKNDRSDDWFQNLGGGKPSA